MMAGIEQVDVNKAIIEFDGVAEIEEIEVDFENWKQELIKNIKALYELGIISEEEKEKYIKYINSQPD